MANEYRRMSASTTYTHYGKGDPGYHVAARILIGDALLADVRGPNTDGWQGTPIPGIGRTATHEVALAIEALAEMGFSVWAMFNADSHVKLYVQDSTQPPPQWHDRQTQHHGYLEWPAAIRIHLLSGTVAAMRTITTRSAT